MVETPPLLPSVFSPGSGTIRAMVRRVLCGVTWDSPLTPFCVSGHKSLHLLQHSHRSHLSHIAEAGAAVELAPRRDAAAVPSGLNGTAGTPCGSSTSLSTMYMPASFLAMQVGVEVAGKPWTC